MVLVLHYTTVFDLNFKCVLGHDIIKGKESVMRCVKGHSIKGSCVKFITITIIITLKTLHHILSLHFKTVEENQSDIPIVNLASTAFLETIEMVHAPNL